jgi:type II secretory pathway component PulM
MAKHYFYENYLRQGFKLKQDHPLLFLSICIVAGFLIYYLLVLMPLNNAIEKGQENLHKELQDFQWMSRASHEILRLKKLTTHDKKKSVDTPFAYVNQHVNDQTWSAMVTDVRQLEQNQVQINFKAISYDHLMTWLQEIYQEAGIFVVEATLERVEPGVVDAMFVLRSHSAEENASKS